jgi:adenine C2-methylase RlmN of 23S rRNA A2503 and tRNA A37
MVNLLASKHLFELEDGNKIQLVTARNNSIICFPSQIGCKHREICKICSAKEYIRDLTEVELLQTIGAVKSDATRLISCMGEGEPTENPAIAKVLNMYSYQYKTAISTRVPLLDNLRMFILHSPYTKIQLSSHSMTLEALDDALALTKKCDVEVNIVAHNDVKFLVRARLARDYNRVVKLSRWNDYRYQEQWRQHIYESLVEEGIEVEIYNHDGREIHASCGQLQSF